MSAVCGVGSGRILGESHRRLLVLHVRAAFGAVHLGPRQPLHGSYGGIEIGEVSSLATLCVSTATIRYVGGSCDTYSPPSLGTWHHWIIRYEGSGTGAGEGGPVSIYIDDVLVFTQINDPSNDPVFSSAMPDVLYVGGDGARMDDLRIYGDVFSQAQQCSYILGGAWTGSGCTLP